MGEHPQTALVREDFPSNSNMMKQKVAHHQDTQTPEPRKAVAKGHVKQRNPNFIEKFLGDDLQSVAGYILQDVLIPSVKSIALDALEMAFFGEIRGKRVNKGSSNAPWYQYVDYSARSRGGSISSSPRRSSSGRSSVRTPADITFDSKWEAEQVVENMAEVINDCGEVSLADFYESAGLPSSHVDYKYGWKDISDVRVIKNRDGSWSIRLPREVQL